LRDINLETLEKPFTNEGIAAYLKEHEVRTTGEQIFDDCLFQSVLFTDFFEKIETGFFERIEPGEIEDQYDRPAQYLLKKSVELLQPLGIKIEECSRRYDALLKTLPKGERKSPNNLLPLVRGMVARFEEIERNLLAVRTDPQGFRPTREKVCFLLFAHAMLSDAVDGLHGRMDDLDPAVRREDARPYMAKVEEENQIIKAYLKAEGIRSELFSPGPLTETDAELCKACLNTQWQLPNMEKLTVPSFAPTGSQGVLAILHGIFMARSC
jgi:hypothetical protein